MKPFPLPSMDVAHGIKRLFPSASVAVFARPDRITHLSARLPARETVAVVTVPQTVENIVGMERQFAAPLLRQLYPRGWAQA